jgi:hypothetical protein
MKKIISLLLYKAPPLVTLERYGEVEFVADYYILWNEPCQTFYNNDLGQSLSLTNNDCPCNGI